MAEVLKRAECTPATLSCLGFHVLAPDEQIKSRTFSRNLDKRSIVGKVERRVSSYEGSEMIGSGIGSNPRWRELKFTR